MAKKKKKAPKPTKAQLEKWASSDGMSFDDPVPKKEADAIALVLDNEERTLKERERRRRAKAAGRDPKAPIRRTK